MADDVATVSSSPALGFVSVCMADRSYSRRRTAIRLHHRGLVDQTDHHTKDDPLDQTGHAEAQRDLAPEMHHRVVDQPDRAADEDAETSAEPRAFDRARSTFVALRVDV